MALKVKENGVFKSLGGHYYPPSEDKPVKFWDFNGELLYQFDYAELAELEEMPEPPNHLSRPVPLEFQEWNYTLAEVKAFNRPHDVGAIYVTADGKTHFIIDLPYDNFVLRAHWQQTVANGVVVDWGDGSATQMFSGTGAINHAHTYATKGTYDISLNAVDGFCYPGHPNIGSVGVFGRTGGMDGGGNSSEPSGQLFLREVYQGAHEQGFFLNNAFNGCTRLHLYSGVRRGTLQEGLFDSCYSLRHINLPRRDVPASAGIRVFNSCYNLERVSIPPTYNALGTSLFENCYKLNIILPNTMATLGTSSLAGVRAGLKDFHLPSAVTAISDNAFTGSYWLGDVGFLDRMTNIGENAFQFNCVIEEAYIPSICASLGAYAFASCRVLRKVSIEDGPTTIGQYAFSYCSCLEEITLNHGLVTLPEYLFRGCYSLRAIDIPATVNSIAQYTFYDMGWGIKTLTMLGSTPPTIGSGSANPLQHLASDAIIRVPIAAESTYKAATGWSAHAAKIVGY